MESIFFHLNESCLKLNLFRNEVAGLFCLSICWLWKVEMLHMFTKSNLDMPESARGQAPDLPWEQFWWPCWSDQLGKFPGASVASHGRREEEDVQLFQGGCRRAYRHSCARECQEAPVQEEWAQQGTNEPDRWGNPPRTLFLSRLAPRLLHRHAACLAAKGIDRFHRMWHDTRRDLRWAEGAVSGHMLFRASYGQCLQALVRAGFRGDAGRIIQSAWCKTDSIDDRAAA